VSTAAGSELLCIGGGPVADGAGIFFDPGGILLQEGRIVEAGPFENVVPKADRIVDTRGRLIMPGFVNFHHHLYSHFAPGIRPKAPAATFQGILENLWWPLDYALDEEAVYLSALAGLLESVRCGVTTVFDHHASMGKVRGSLAAIARAFAETGVRGLLCFETSGRRGHEDALAHIEENLAFAEALPDGGTPRSVPGKSGEAAEPAPMLGAALGLHANFTLSAKVLEAVREAKPAGLPIHIHCGEATEDLEFCIAEGFAGPVDRLASFGLVGEKSLLVHCVHLSDRDFDLLRELRPVIIVNPESNANNQVGFPDFRRLPSFVVGTDGMTGDMIASYRAAALLGGERGLDFSLLRRAVFHGALRVRRSFFPGTGLFRPGAAADITVLDYVPLAPLSEENLLGHMVYGAKSGRAWMTVCNGKILWQAGTFPGLDEEDILRRAGRAAKALHRRFYG
jgi:cytosine/adenosine deaminase-related metal-dependent hydrolase